MSQPFYKPEELAQEWKVSPDKVREWIARGELIAVDLSDRPGIGRQIRRVSHEEKLAFEQRRQTRTPPKPKRRRKRLANVPRYF